MPQPAISIIIPTFNRAAQTSQLLSSLVASENQDFEIIINDDARSADQMAAVASDFRAQGLAIHLLHENRSSGQARRRGAANAHGRYLLHLDSDMLVSPKLLGECQRQMRRYDALVIPERSFGTNFWARCKCLEKQCYEGVVEVESLRCIKKAVYDALGGHDEQLIFSEDKDLDIRVRQAGYAIGRTRAYLRHDEGSPTLCGLAQKKMHYTKTANLFATKHPAHFRWETNPWHRYMIFLRNKQYGKDHPLLYLGLFFMKTTEYALGGLTYLTTRVTRSFSRQ